VVALKASGINNKDKDDKEKVKAITNNSNKNNQCPTKEELKSKKEIIIQGWLANIIKEKLQRIAILSTHTHKPICLYKNIIEEQENAAEEEISYLMGNYIINFVYSYGGYVPTSFKTIEVFTLDRFTKWILHEEKKDLLLQYLEEIEHLL
jgi:hypothetical protein